MTSASRSTFKWDSCRFWRMCCVQSGMVWSHDVVNRQNELVPDATLRGEIFAADWRQAVEPASALPGFFHPAAGDEISPFQPAEDGIERADAKLDTPFGARLDQLANFVAMARSRFD